MRRLSTTEMLTAVEATPENRDAAMPLLAPLVDTRQLERLTAEGILTAVILQHNGESVYCFWYHQSVDGGFHVNAAAQLTPRGPGFEALAAAIEGLAVKLGCQYVRLQTARRGLLEKALSLNYKAQAVTLLKPL